MRYVGYFHSFDDKPYMVEIGNHSDADVTTILLAGESPFVVDYTNSKTPFDTLRTSTATITIVHDDYLFDVFSAQAQGTKVTLYDMTYEELEREIVVWTGYLKSNLYNQGYTDEYETIELEASDCLASLQYIEYNPATKVVRTFKSLLGDICTKAGLDAFYVVKSKYVNGSLMDMNSLKISDNNFFSSDSTKTPWKYSDILSEICNYLSYTALQWGSSLYLLDYQVYHSAESMSASCWLKSESYATAYTATLGSVKNIVKDSYRGNDASISMDTVINKVKVNANFYEVSDFIPQLFDEELITNIAGDKYASNIIPIPQPYQPSYIDGRNKAVQEEKADTNYTYLEKTWNNSMYTTKVLDSETYQPVVANYSYRVVSIDPIMDPQYGTTVTGYQVNMGYRNNTGNDVTLYVNLTCGPESETETYTLNPYATLYNVIAVATDDDSPLIGTLEISITHNGTTTTFLPQPMSDFNNHVISASLVETASVPVPAVPQYFYETESDVDFKQYVRFNCENKPTGRLQPSDLAETQIETYYPSLLELNNGYTCPIVIDGTSTFLYLNATAINERYASRPYINPDWSGQATGIKGEYNLYRWGIISGEKHIWTAPPTLIFKLGIGNLWWTGTRWQNSECAFYVQLGMDTTDDNVPDYSKLWNTEHKVLNNVDWRDWAGVSGYKIPLNGIDLSNEIHFEMLLPSRVQDYSGTSTITPSFNSFVWVNNFSLKVGTKGAKNFDNADVVYENIVDSGSTNEMSEITVKFTTHAGQGNLSYSTVGYGNYFLGDVTDVYLTDNTARIQEENIIQRYVEQYGTPTKKEELTVSMDFTPLDKIVDTYWNQNFVILGQNIDYKRGSQKINIIEKK